MSLTTRPSAAASSQADRHGLIQTVLTDLHARLKPESSGHLADYIPELANADPNQFGIVIATVDGAIYAVGDADVEFTIQSISKAFVFGLALEDHGRDEVLAKVGVEPSGDAFNSIVFDTRANRPLNPMVNTGAIATSGLVVGDSADHRLGRVREMFSRYVGRELQVNEPVYLSEKATGHRNRAIAHLELNFGMIDDRIDDHLDVYFQQCSLMVTARDLAVMAATLANGGVNPQTQVRAIEAQYAKNVISVMNSCGMYDYSGEWAYRIGLPAKSGVGGGIIAVLPGAMGIGVFSPPLDTRGNSVRGIKVCETLSHQFGLNMFDPSKGVVSAIRREYDAASIASKRNRSEQERAVLDEVGKRVLVLEVRGVIDFTAVEQISRRLGALGPEVDHVLIDLKRADQIDPQSAALLVQIVALQEEAGRHLRFAVYPEAVCDMRLRAAGMADGQFFETIDAALEWAEDAVLTGQPHRAEAEKAFAQMDLVAGMDDRQLAALQAVVERRAFRADEVIMREGDAADQLFFLAAGTVSIRLRGADGHSQRLATLDPGVAFGEMALLDGAPRSADVQADTDVVVYALGLDRLNKLASDESGAQAALLRNVGRQLAQRLRRANREIGNLVA